MPQQVLKAWRAQSPAVFPVKLAVCGEVIRADARALLQACGEFRDCWDILAPGATVPIVCGVTPATVREAVGHWYGEPLRASSLEDCVALLTFADYVNSQVTGFGVLDQALGLQQFPLRELWGACRGLPNMRSVCSRMFRILYTNVRCQHLFDVRDPRVRQDFKLDRDPHGEVLASLTRPLAEAVRAWTGLEPAEAVAQLQHDDPDFLPSLLHGPEQCAASAALAALGAHSHAARQPVSSPERQSRPASPPAHPTSTRGSSPNASVQV